MKKLIVILYSFLICISFTACVSRVILLDDSIIVISDLSSFRAKVLEFDSNYGIGNNEFTLFVYSLTSVVGHPIGSRYFISKNDNVIFLDINGETILYSDITSGSMVEITFAGLVLESDPAVIPGATLIQIVE